MDPLTRLACSAAAGDREAAEALVRATYDQVWRLCAALVDPRSADDLAQESILKAVRALPSYRGDAAARTWLLAIARHTCLDELRARYRRAERSGRWPGGQDGALGDASGEPVVNDLLARLDPDRRGAFVLTQILGLSYREAAQVCGCPQGTIRSRVARARADLLKAVRSPEIPTRHPRPGGQSGTA